MVARFKVVADDMTAQQWLLIAHDDVLGCKGQGHRFPKIRRGRQAKGLDVRPPVDGVFRVLATCPDCGTIRIEDSLPGGSMPTPHRYTYIYQLSGPMAYRPPKGVKVTRRDAFDETWRRTREDIPHAVQTA